VSKRALARKYQKYSIWGFRRPHLGSMLQLLHRHGECHVKVQDSYLPSF
jgi:hypothetical protein